MVEVATSANVRMLGDDDFQVTEIWELHCNSVHATKVQLYGKTHSAIATV